VPCVHRERGAVRLGRTVATRFPNNTFGCVSAWVRGVVCSTVYPSVVRINGWKWKLDCGEGTVGIDVMEVRGGGNVEGWKEFQISHIDLRVCGVELSHLSTHQHLGGERDLGSEWTAELESRSGLSFGRL